MNTGVMSATGDGMHQLITEVITEIDTAEIALWAAALCAAAVVVSTAMSWWLRRRGDASAGSWSFAVVRCLAVVVPFAVLTRQVADSGWLTGADAATLAWLSDHRSSGWTTAAVAVTTAGGPVGVAVIGCVVSGIWVWRRRSPRPAVILIGTLLVTAAVNTVCKLAVGRARPPVPAHLVVETDWSYPSGHVSGTVALAGAVVLIYLPEARTSVRRTVAVVLAVLGVCAVAVSRLYLGVHWLTDVIGGALLGTAVVLVTAAVIAARPVATPQPDSTHTPLRAAMSRSPTDTPPPHRHRRTPQRRHVDTDVIDRSEWGIRRVGRRHIGVGTVRLPPPGSRGSGP
jgi:membrane-associated phospholipid phosphatase